MGEIIQTIAYSNYDGFPHLNSKFHKKSFHYFKGYLMTKITLKWIMHKYLNIVFIVFHKYNEDQV
jgi:hypothetical protein